jgi:hypothetical protein
VPDSPIATEAEHRALAYIAAVNRGGAMPSSMELVAFMSGGFFGSGAVWWTELPLKFANLGWVMPGISVGLRLTDVGTAVLRQLDQQEKEEAPEVLELVLDPSDRLAYARLVTIITQMGPAMLVDPYFELDQMLLIVDHTAVTRVLMSDEHAGRKGIGARIGAALQTIKLPRSFEVRKAVKRANPAGSTSDSSRDSRTTRSGAADGLDRTTTSR